ncbi:DUF2399 domain-containing protein [Streptomyces sp. NBC_01431]|uniref:DUF2399 domain-containing protein n=1 Tax=Streptomyces sp. NBC_01431 TaxID=2903863 RepID=UPI002E330611|nr:DUF2399 domain-containing protein [Streptomyces sp. NBC_01431]
MTNQLIDRYQAEPWQMSATDYLVGSRTGAEQTPLNGRPQTTGWDPELAAAMQREDRVVYEEAVADSLLKSMSVTTICPQGRADRSADQRSVAASTPVINRSPRQLF